MTVFSYGRILAEDMRKSHLINRRGGAPSGAAAFINMKDIIIQIHVSFIIFLEMKKI